MMGAKNVKAVFASWGHLQGPAFRLLTYIAVTVLDGPRPRCELSREALAEGLGHRTWDVAARNAVDRAISSLKVAGALAVAQVPSRGRRAHYWLELSAPVTLPPDDCTSSREVHNDDERTSSSEVHSRANAPHSASVCTSPSEVQTAADTVLPLSGTHQEKDAAASPPLPRPHLHAIAGGATMPNAHAKNQPGLWPAPVPDPAPAAAGDTPSVTAQTIVGEWIDRCAKRPPSRVIGQVAKYMREMLAEGIDPDDIRRGTAAWMVKGLHPAALPAVVNEVMNGGRTTAATQRPSTTDQRVKETLALGARLQADADRKAIGHG